jgi:hypothetical protein
MMIIRYPTLVALGSFAILVSGCSRQPDEVKSSPAVEAAPAGDREAAPAAAVAAEPEAARTNVPARSPAPRPSALTASGTPAARADSEPRDGRPDAPREPDPGPRFREVTLPAGTSLPLDLRTAVASDTSDVEDRVTGALRRSITIDGFEVLPAGTVLVGHVTEAARSAKVKGRGRVAFRFTSVDLPGEGGATPIRTSLVVRQAAGTKRQDAAKIGGGAAGGAVLGAIFGGGGGAAKGAAIGGAAGTGVVLATRGKDVHLPAGTDLVVTLQAPLTVSVRQ